MVWDFRVGTMHGMELANAAKYFLIEELTTKTKEAPQILEAILVPDQVQFKTDSLSPYYNRMLISARNANMKTKVIGSIIHSDANFGRVLFDFNPSEVLQFSRKESAADGGVEYLREYLLKELGAKTPSGANSIFTKYCRTIISAAEFVVQFQNSDELRSWFDLFYKDPKMKEALPLLLSEEVYGFGYALACDFLKEVGFIEYGKPDIHIKDILVGLNFIAPNETPYKVQKTLGRLAAEANVTPYELDKLLWLIGSGTFYPVRMANGELSDSYQLERRSVDRKESFIKRFEATNVTE